MHTEQNIMQDNNQDKTSLLNPCGFERSLKQEGSEIKVVKISDWTTEQLTTTPPNICQS